MVPLERIEPVVRTFDLGPLRVTQDELVEIVRLTRSITNVEVRLESDGNTLTDVTTDLPELGRQVSYFRISVKRVGANSWTPDVININFKDIGRITTTDPDAEILGHIEFIKAIVAPYRRMPQWLFGLFRSKGILSKDYSLRSIIFSICLSLLYLIGIGIFSILRRKSVGHDALVLPWPGSLIFLTVAIVLLGLIGIGTVLSRTVIYTSTRATSPTFWERHRSTIAIHVAVGGLFFLLGILVGHA